MLDTHIRARLEQLADELEAIARSRQFKSHMTSMEIIAPRMSSDLFGLAWNIKQIARWDTPSFGV